MSDYSITPLGYIQTCFSEKFGIPRQPLLAPSAKGVLTLDEPFNDPGSVLGLESVSHVWLSFIFHEHVNHSWKAKVRPPRLGGNKKMGVFATRSSFRPNNIGLSVVKLDRVETHNHQVALFFSGVDLLDGTPIIDIKPYVPYVDSLPYSSNQFAQSAPTLLPVSFALASDTLKAVAREEEVLDDSGFKQLVIEVLQQDPRPAYHEFDQDRIYGMNLQGKNIRWRYSREDGDDLTIVVVDITDV